tara:strand:- start:1117 stop:1290 length:174 start_codon:yes stop_codon:yes gene_type:complete
MEITSAKYYKDIVTDTNTSIEATINGKTWSVPIDTANTHYQAIQEWVAEGNTIQEAD